MYIPLGPSKKQLYKILIVLLFLIFILISRVNAATYSGPLNYSPSPRIFDLNGVSSALVPIYNDSGNEWIIYSGSGEGTLVFSLYYYCNSQPCHPLTEVAVQDNNGNQFACEFDSPMWYVDNDKQYEVITPTCNVLFNNYGLKYVILRRAGNAGRLLGRLGVNSTFITRDINVNISQQEVIDAITSSNQNIRNELINQGTTMNNISSDTNDIKNAINDSSIDNSSATDFKNNSAFQDSNGLDAIIKAPLSFIQSLTSSTCSSISLTIPYIDANVNLPCMSTIYNKALGQQLVNLIALVINGVVLYRYCLKILQIVKDAKNPNKDGLEVLDL